MLVPNFGIIFPVVVPVLVFLSTLILVSKHTQKRSYVFIFIMSKKVLHFHQLFRFRSMMSFSGTSEISCLENNRRNRTEISICNGLNNRLDPVDSE